MSDVPDEQLSRLQVTQVEELPDTQRPPQGVQGAQVRQVLFERSAPLGDRLRCEVPAQLLPCTHDNRKWAGCTQGELSADPHS